MTIGFLLLIILSLIPGYIMGSINGAIIASNMLYRKDIRDYGSGNPGLTNAYRVFGTGCAILVFTIDVLKTIVPVIFGGWLFANITSIIPLIEIPEDWFISITLFGQALTGLSVMMGHCFPLFYKFKGGKGVMAIGAIVIILNWKIALIAWGIFILLTAATRYVSLGSVIGVSSLPITMIMLGVGGPAEVVVITLCTLLIVIRHAENIERLFKGTEHKLGAGKKHETDVNDATVSTNEEQ